MGLRRRVSSSEVTVPHRVQIRSPVRHLSGHSRRASTGNDGDGDDEVVEVDVRWWAECAVLALVAVGVAARLPGVALIDRVAAVAVVAGTMATASIADASHHLHFCRVSVDTGLVSGGSLVPLAMLVQSSLAAEEASAPSWRLFFWMSVLMTASTLAWLVAVRLGSPFAEVMRRDAAAGAAGYALLAAHCAGVFGSPCPPWASAAYGVALYGLVCRALASTVPQSFTLGEAMLLAQGCVLLLVEMCYRIAGGPTVLPAGAAPAVFAACLLAGASALVLTWLPASVWVCRRGKGDAVTVERGTAVHPWAFTLMLAGGAAGIAVPATSAVLGQGSAAWLLRYVASSWSHATALAYWAVCLAAAVPAVHSASSGLLLSEPPVDKPGAELEEALREAWRRRRQLFYRKLYHFLALVLLVPVLLADAEFLSVGCASALLLMCALECLRVANASPVGQLLHDAMERYRDEKDPGELLTTHLYLLLACAAPLWLSGSAAAPALTGLGLVSVGLGDATASIAGGRWGATRIFGTRKTVEGAAASAAAQAVAVAALCAAGEWAGGGAALSPVPTSAVLAVVTGAAYEAVTLQSDNLVIPLVVWSIAASDAAVATAAAGAADAAG